MKPSALVFLALLGLASASLQGNMTRKPPYRRVSMLKPKLRRVVPPSRQGPLPKIKDQPDQEISRVKRSASAMFPGNENLKWVTWDGNMTRVGIYNSYTERTDYVCRSENHSCHAGFVTDSMGPDCYYTYKGIVWRTKHFKILANIDNFEFLEWKDGSYGSVPANSIKTCSNGEIYVARNKYGLGHVAARYGAFYLPWLWSSDNRKEYWYRHYQVLTINRDHYTQEISNVRYSIDEAKIFQYPPETMRRSRVTNNQCRELVKTVTLSKTTSEENTWNSGYSLGMSISTTIKTGIPFIAEGEVTVSAEASHQFNGGTSKVTSRKHEVSVQITVPPNHSCIVRLEGRTITTDIPFTARLSRTYRNGETKWTSINGKYKGVESGDIQAVAERCKPVANANPCP